MTQHIRKVQTGVQSIQRHTRYDDKHKNTHKHAGHLSNSVYVNAHSRIGCVVIRHAESYVGSRDGISYFLRCPAIGI